MLKLIYTTLVKVNILSLFYWPIPEFVKKENVQYGIFPLLMSTKKYLTEWHLGLINIFMNDYFDIFCNTYKHSNYNDLLKYQCI